MICRRTITSSYYRGTNAIIVVCAADYENSIDSLGRWLSEKDRYADNDVLVVIAVNKKDLVGQKASNFDDLLSTAKKHNLGYIEVSALTGEGIDDLFRIIAEEFASLDFDNNDQPKWRYPDDPDYLKPKVKAIAASTKAPSQSDSAETTPVSPDSPQETKEQKEKNILPSSSSSSVSSKDH